MNEQERVNQKLKESWEHINPYIDNENVTGELHKMCKVCEAWYGVEHDYKNCIDKPCFKFWLAYQYLCWEASWE